MAGDKTFIPDEDANPYIALADLAINLVLVLAFFVAAVNALGRAGWEQVKYRDAQKEFRDALIRNSAATLPARLCPRENAGKNDPPGVQRWVYSGSALFEANGDHLRPDGRTALMTFAAVLRGHRANWRRVRIEGHTRLGSATDANNWKLSSDRAAEVAQLLFLDGHIQPNFLAVAGRAAQDPFNKSNLNDPVNDRVEILVEYAQRLPQRAGAPR